MTTVTRDHNGTWIQDDIVLTRRQEAVLAAIRDSVHHRGYPPSQREIGDAVGLTSTSSVSHHLQRLQRLGYLRLGHDRSRAIELVRTPAVITAETAAHVLHSYGYSGREPGGFTASLIEAIARADAPNRAALAAAYPGYVAAVELIERDADGADRLFGIAFPDEPAEAGGEEMWHRGRFRPIADVSLPGSIEQEGAA